MSLRPLPAGSTGNNLKVTQGNSLKPGGQRLEGHKGLTNTSVPKLQIVEFGKMYRFLTTSAKVRPFFGRPMRISLQGFIDIIYKVPAQQVQPEDDDSACDRCENPGKTEMSQPKEHMDCS